MSLSNVRDRGYSIELKGVGTGAFDVACWCVPVELQSRETKLNMFRLRRHHCQLQPT